MIRKYKNEDRDTIMKIWKEENINTHNFIDKKYWEDNYEYVKNILPNSEIWVYLLKNEIVGFIGLNENFIEGIFIKKGFKNKGIGTEIIEYIKKQKNELQLKVYEKNLRAIEFYKKQSFKIKTKEIDDNTREYEYLMEWNSK